MEQSLESHPPNQGAEQSSKEALSAAVQVDIRSWETLRLYDSLRGESAELSTEDKDFLERKLRCLDIAAESMPLLIRRSILEQVRSSDSLELPPFLEINLAGEPKSITINMELAGVAQGGQALAQARRRIEAETKQSISEKEALEFLRDRVRLVFYEMIGQEEVDGILSIRSGSRMTGVIGDQGGGHMEFVIANALRNANELINSYCGAENVEKDRHLDVRAIISTTPQKVVLATIDSTRNDTTGLQSRVATKEFPGDSVVITNNMAGYSGEGASQIMMVRFATSEEISNPSVIEIKEKGTFAKIEASFNPKEIPTPTTLSPETNPPEKQKLSFDEKLLLATVAVDSFLTPEMLINLFSQQKFGKFLDALENQGECVLPMGITNYDSTEYGRIWLASLAGESVIAKPDISGFSQLTGVLEKDLGIPVQHFTYPIFAIAIRAARKAGGLVDNIAGDSVDVSMLPNKALEELGVGIEPELAKYNTHERAVLFSIALNLAFKDTVDRLEAIAREKYSNEFAVLDEDNQERIAQLAEEAKVLVANAEIVDDALVGLAIGISQRMMSRSLSMKSVAAAETNSAIIIQKARSEFIQRVRKESFNAQEKDLETASSKNHGRPTISVETFNGFQSSSGFEEKFEPLVDKAGSVFAYILKEEGIAELEKIVRGTLLS